MFVWLFFLTLFCIVNCYTNKMYSLIIEDFQLVFVQMALLTHTGMILPLFRERNPSQDLATVTTGGVAAPQKFKCRTYCLFA